VSIQVEIQTHVVTCAEENYPNSFLAVGESPVSSLIQTARGFALKPSTEAETCSLKEKKSKKDQLEVWLYAAGNAGAENRRLARWFFVTLGLLAVLRLRPGSEYLRPRARSRPCSSCSAPLPRHPRGSPPRRSKARGNLGTGAVCWPLRRPRKGAGGVCARMSGPRGRKWNK